MSMIRFAYTFILMWMLRNHLEVSYEASRDILIALVFTKILTYGVIYAIGRRMRAYYAGRNAHNPKVKVTRDGTRVEIFTSEYDEELLHKLWVNEATNAAVMAIMWFFEVRMAFIITLVTEVPRILANPLVYQFGCDTLVARPFPEKRNNIL